jgi:pSer/pThr/pTyr-binding forkhead associated (FHA) protein
MIVSFFIEIVTQAGETRRVSLQQGRLIVGRSAKSSAIVLDDARVSRVHLQIVRDFDQGVMVTDLRSANGTTLDGNPLPPNAPTPWALGQIIGVGQTQLILKYGSIENNTDTPAELESSNDAPTISD